MRARAGKARAAADASTSVAPDPARNVKAALGPALQSPVPPDTRADPDIPVFLHRRASRFAEGQAMCVPIAQYLNQTIGRNVVYRYPGTWGAHFIGYRSGK